MSEEREREEERSENDERNENEHERERERTERNERNGRERDENYDENDKRVKRGSGELCPTSLLVRNISYRVTTTEIRSLMEKHGEVRDVYIPLDHHSGRSRGFAFVEFFDARDAK